MTFEMQWRALGVDDTPEGPKIDVISGPVSEWQALDTVNDADPPYDRIVVQKRVLQAWTTVNSDAATPSTSFQREGTDG